MTLDWQSIRPLNGGRDKGFEELCAQLARAETPSGFQFERKGTPDAGVECYATSPDGSEWGWQSKYFDSLDDSQWSQLDDSVETALTKHPRLVRYFVCIPLDRPDARVAGRKSAKERWDSHAAKWVARATALSMKVEFVYWGSSELIERLARTEHVGRLRFWFDRRGFDSAWFSARLEEALSAAGPRYTPEVHVELPVAAEFDAFGRTSRLFDREKSHARSIRERFGNIRSSEASIGPEFESELIALRDSVAAVLKALGTIEPQPIGMPPFKAIADLIAVADAKADELSPVLRTFEKEFDSRSSAPRSDDHRTRNPYADKQIQLRQLRYQFEAVRESLLHAQELAGSPLLILDGAAGTGKTHLLCDISRKRLAAGLPTVLLMGQQFVNSDAPWVQALQQLDLPALSAEEFVGALEAAAQAANARALLIVDAINEGAGRTIWPSHLSAFLVHAQRSPWIAVALSIRSSYTELIVPAEVRSKSVEVTHRGFADSEYDATKTFFIHYGLELPSTPLLAPEFRNPLFLKTLCSGLNATGESRLPRGLQGISAVFDLYLRAVEGRLAPSLDFDPRLQLVRQALEALARAMSDSDERWLSYATAAGLVNGYLPGRGFERSLYRGLVAEGVLVEEVVRDLAGSSAEVVFVSYERFADHLIVKTLLDRHLDVGAPASAFESGAPLAFVCDESKYLSPGTLEAFCVQLPEKTGQELIFVAPACTKRWAMGDAFRQSLIWRAYSAVSDETLRAVNQLIRTDHDHEDTIEILLTVSTLPEHPFNAEFLDRNLRRRSLADRDAWWSIVVHKKWRGGGAVDRLVDWAWSQRADARIAEDAVLLCAIALAWMLTTSNRFLRDRATKALASLLTGRVHLLTRLAERFADVDDPYVSERVYAVAYGVSMRSHDPVALGELANVVYDRVFRSLTPPPQILLRDYARGVVERALYLGAGVDAVPSHIRPPYRSTWPAIPTQDEIKPLLPDWSKGSHDSRQLEWARNRIGSSIMSDDFGLYVIGTNSSSTARDWLSLTLAEPRWQPPLSPDSQLNSLRNELSTAAQLKAWDDFIAIDRESSFASIHVWFVTGPPAQEDAEPAEAPSTASPHSEAEEVERKLAVVKERRALAFAALQPLLSGEQMQQLEAILASRHGYSEARRAPHLALDIIQRYVLWRAFDLGWTIDRFGAFDRFSIGYRGREASKAERIGKKYQWIAYREILAFISDRYQYYDAYGDEGGEQAYDGPWQTYLRDIDPSCTMKELRGGTSWQGHEPAWWGPMKYESWGDGGRQREWVADIDSLPRVEDLLTIRHPQDRSAWVNAHGYFNWKQQAPADREPSEVERREVWYIATGYLVKAAAAPLFVQWAEKVDFWGRWMPDAPQVYRLFLGEHGWAPASRSVERGDANGWTNPGRACPTEIKPIAFEYLNEGSGFDCSVDKSFRLSLPAAEALSGMGLRWTGEGADFVDGGGRVGAQDPTVHGDGPSALLLREEVLRDYLSREGLALVWAVFGEKGVLPPGLGDGPRFARLKLTGAYMLLEGRLSGFLKYSLDEPPSAPGESDSNEQIVGTIRTDRPV